MILLLTLLAIIAVVIAMYVVDRFNFINYEWSRFILTGGFNTFNYYLLYLILIKSLPYMQAHFSAFIYSGFVSYFVSSKYTFKEELSLIRFLKFPITYIPNLVISSVVTYTLVTNQLVSETFASIIAMIIAIPVTFFVTRLVLKGKK